MPYEWASPAACWWTERRAPMALRLATADELATAKMLAPMPRNTTVPTCDSLRLFAVHFFESRGRAATEDLIDIFVRLWSYNPTSRAFVEAEIAASATPRKDS